MFCSRHFRYASLPYYSEDLPALAETLSHIVDTPVLQRYLSRASFLDGQLAVCIQKRAAVACCLCWYMSAEPQSDREKHFFTDGTASGEKFSM